MAVTVIECNESYIINICTEFKHNISVKKTLKRLIMFRDGTFLIEGGGLRREGSLVNFLQIGEGKTFFFSQLGEGHRFFFWQGKHD